MSHKRERKLQEKEQKNSQLIEIFLSDIKQQRAQLQRQIAQLNELIGAIEWKLISQEK